MLLHCGSTTHGRQCLGVIEAVVIVAMCSWTAAHTSLIFIIVCTSDSRLQCRVDARQPCALRKAHGESPSTSIYAMHMHTPVQSRGFAHCGAASLLDWESKTAVLCTVVRCIALRPQDLLTPHITSSCTSHTHACRCCVGRSVVCLCWCRTSISMLEIADLGGRGRGMRATRAVRAGTLLLAESPMSVVHPEEGLGTFARGS